MPCCTALRTSRFNGCCQCRTPRRGWSLVLGDLSTSRRSCARYTGYPSVSESRSNWQRLSTSAWTARPRRPDWLLSTDWRPSLRSEISGDLDTPRAAREIHIRRQIICCRTAKHLKLTCLVPAIRDPSLSSQGFRRLLKTYLFGWRMRR